METIGCFEIKHIRSLDRSGLMEANSIRLARALEITVKGGAARDFMRILLLDDLPKGV